jgi:hypothetical protein
MENAAALHHDPPARRRRRIPQSVVVPMVSVWLL